MSLLKLSKPMVRLAMILACALTAMIGEPGPSKAEVLRGLDAYRGGDYRRAYEQLKPLAERGNADAQYYLGMMYAQGEGVSANSVDSVKWLTCAAKQIPPADRLKNQLLKRMNSAQIELAAREGRATCGSVQRAGSNEARAEGPAYEESETRDSEERSRNLKFVPERRSAVERVAFYPGDTTFIGLLEFSDAVQSRVVRQTVLFLLATFGDFGLAAISVVWWLLLLRIIVAIAGYRTKPAATRRYHTPPGLGLRNPGYRIVRGERPFITRVAYRGTKAPKFSVR